MQKRVKFIAFIHILVIALLLSVYLNKFFSPYETYYLWVVPFIYPLLLILNVVLIIYWVIKKKKILLVCIILLALTYFLSRPYINYPFFKGNGKEDKKIKMLTYNVNYGCAGQCISDLDEYIRSNDFDIVFLQEIYKRQWKDDFFLIDRNNAFFDLVGISSKYPIVKKKKIELPGNSYAGYADIKIGKNIIRVISVYLESIRLTKKELGGKKEASEITKNIANRLEQGNWNHEVQIEILRKYIEESPYPVIFSGDLNSVPYSYEYFYLGKGFKEVFRESGKGLGLTFFEFKYPIKIDYTFISDAFRPMKAEVDKSIKISDHYPMISEIEFKK